MDNKTAPDEKTKEPKWIHVELPGGGTATVSATAKPETLAALDRLVRISQQRLKTKRKKREKEPSS